LQMRETEISSDLLTPEGIGIALTGCISIILIGLRMDGRRPNELRRIRAKLGVNAHADGSAHVEFGLTKLMVHVYGPREVDMRVCIHSKSCIISSRPKKEMPIARPSTWNLI
jgi:hypothetical protein